MLGHARRALGDFAGAVEAFELGEAAAAERGLEPYRLELVMLRAATLTDLGGSGRSQPPGAGGAPTGRCRSVRDVNDLWARIVEGFVLLRSDPAAATVGLRGGAPRRGRSPLARVARWLPVRASPRHSCWRATWRGRRTRWTGLLELLAAQGAQSDLRSILHLAGALLLSHAAGRGRPRTSQPRASPCRTSAPFVRTTEELFPIPVEDGHVLAPSAALRLALRMRAGGAQGLRRHGRSTTVSRRRCERAGDLWALWYEGRSVHLKATKGLDDLARLLGRARTERSTSWTSSGLRWRSPATGPLLDRDGRRRLEDRIRELQAELDDADAANDLARSEQAAAELDAVVDHLAAALGLGGRDRARAPAPPSGPGRP